MRRSLAIFLTLHPIPLNFLIYEENFIFFFISVAAHTLCTLHLYLHSSLPTQVSGNTIRCKHFDVSFTNVCNYIFAPIVIVMLDLEKKNL